MVRFRSVGKLAPRVVGPFPITERIGQMAYIVKLPENLSSVHDVFHVSHLRKCLHDTAEVVEPSMLEEVEVEWEEQSNESLPIFLGQNLRSYAIRK